MPKLDSAYVETMRERIRVAEIIKRLHSCIQKDDMSREQIAAAKILLAKVIPDLKAIELSGPGGGAIRVTLSSKDENL